MFTKNIQRMSSLIEKLCAKIDRNDLIDLVIFGSAAVILNGKDLKREINDLDLYAPDTLFSALKVKYSFHEAQKTSGISYLKVGIPKIEIWKSFPGVSYDQARKNAIRCDHSNGLLVACLEDLRVWKRTQGRKKDLIDLQYMII